MPVESKCVITASAPVNQAQSICSQRPNTSKLAAQNIENSRYSSRNEFDNSNQGTNPCKSVAEDSSNMFYKHNSCGPSFSAPCDGRCVSIKKPLHISMVLFLCTYFQGHFVLR